jgi:hypothetical protein
VAAPTGQGCDGSIKVDEGCTCLKPFWNGTACVEKKPAETCPHTIHRGCWCAKPFYDTKRQSCVEKPSSIDCRAQATSNTGYFASCQGTRGKDRDTCIDANKKVCMKQPGSTW